MAELKLRNLPLQDRDIAEVIEGIQPGLATISFNQSRFGPLAFEPLLRQHAASLTGIYLGSKTFTVTSAMVQKILTTCHQLMRFGADMLNVRDILGIADIDAEDSEDVDEEGGGKNKGRDWVCTKLTLFEVFICGLKDKPLSWHKGVFKQLSRLECLEELYVGACTEFKENTQRSVFQNETICDGLDMRLEAGLGSLSSLKQLVGVGFSYMKQELDEEDVRWMVASWPNLMAVFGELNTERSKSVRLAAILEERGIRTTVDELDSDVEEQDFDLFEMFQVYWY
ncbi:hypothetical protein BGZ80_006908 [Entomortierella chlamydospora]|uniref:Uncharacterized protein n=1 Tax=Entomortierella chlamydospora TaxID=101097 RepID=A0A9P6MG19_9FUNG|nr:hypothetical protein BGZ79_010467 [Entomortierella chlamydospora]KAF9997890.1 hypothetical protein BGZ80_006908 [Entomortierella chlamydospora]